jgi:hypothetical protein
VYFPPQILVGRSIAGLARLVGCVEERDEMGGEERNGKRKKKGYEGWPICDA